MNGLALLVMATSVVVGAIWEDSFVMIGLTAFGTVVKGWNEFKNFCTKMDMCRFAYTTYEKTLIDLRTYLRGLHTYIHTYILYLFIHGKIFSLKKN